MRWSLDKRDDVKEKAVAPGIPVEVAVDIYKETPPLSSSIEYSYLIKVNWHFLYMWIPVLKNMTI
jgi:hypothetical protein